MNEEGSLFDVPPAALGRFRVQHAIGAGASGPVFRGEDPDTHVPVALKAFGTNLGPERAHRLAQALSDLVETAPAHEALAAPIEAGLDETEPFLASRLADGDPLDKALREFGPAAIVDLVPRLSQLAEALDLAASRGIVHGALKPSDVRVSSDSTVITGLGLAAIAGEAGLTSSPRKPYAAPEVVAGGERGPAADQFALAVIAYEWLFGRPPATSGGDLSVPALPGVDRSALAAAFSRALSADPAARFASCAAFAQAVSASVVEADVPMAAQTKPVRARADVARLPLQDAAEPAPELPATVAAPVGAERWAPTAPPRREERWSNTALVVAWAIGALFGLLAGYMAIPRALMQNEPKAVAAPTEPAALPAPDASAPAVVPTSAAPTASQNAPPAPAAEPGRLLVRSNPSGAAVEVDGVARGVTPLAVRDLPLGSRHVVVSHPGYAAADRRVVLSAGRPSRSIDVRLQSAVPRETTPPPVRAEGVGSVLVDSRPPGAQVTIDGRPAGVTPVTVERIAAGEHRITISLAGYQPFAATVRVAAGERARAAASLVGTQEKE